MLSILYYTLVAIGIIPLAIILIPYEYYIAGKKSGESYIKGSVSWFFGGIGISFCKHSHQNMEARIMILGLKKKIDTEKFHKFSGEMKKRIPMGKGSNTRKKMEFNLLPDILKETVSAFLRIFNHCKPKKLVINGRIGFENKAYTGLLCAIKGIAYKYLDKYSVRIQPVFEEKIVEGRFLIGGRIWLAYLILVMIGMFITKPFRNILIADLKMKFKGGTYHVKRI